MTRRRGLSDDDRDAWRHVTHTVRRFSGAESPQGSADPATVAGTATPVRIPARPGGLPAQSPPEPVTPTSTPDTSQPLLAPGDLHMMDRRTATRLRRGQLPLAARLDLHGLPAPAAQAAFERFIRHHHARGDRCVLVITGKGQRSGTDGGVLKRELPHWINLPHLRPLILATTPAQPKDGDAGAMYVMLRRERAP